MSRGPRLAGVALLPLALAAPLAAQTLPIPALPPETAAKADPATTGTSPATPPAIPDTPDVAVPARPRGWEYALGAGIGWDSNINFLVPDGPSGLSVNPRAGLARVFSGPRGRLRATAAGGWTGYPEREELNRHHGDFALDGSYRPSPATFWQMSSSYGFGQTDSSRLLLEQGVSLPIVNTRSIAAALGLRKTAARRSFRLDGRYYRTDFDSPALIDGESLRGTAGLTRQVSNRSTAALEYSLESVRSGPDGRFYLTHYGSLQWTRLLSARSALLLEGGASYTPEAARAGLDQKESFFGGASFMRQVRRSNVTLFVRREVTPAFGIGVSRVALRAGLGATLPMGRAWELRLAGTHIHPGTPGAAVAFGPSDDGFAALGRRLGRHVELSSEARYRRRAKGAASPAIASFQAGLFMTLVSPSGRALAPSPGR